MIIDVAQRRLPPAVEQSVLECGLVEEWILNGTVIVEIPVLFFEERDDLQSSSSFAIVYSQGFLIETIHKVSEGTRGTNPICRNSGPAPVGKDSD